ncbi:helix-turn-helix transcriptional regulator [Halorhodospira sp. 9621]|uniref:helix-turn-helix transcriptional regulator n=1 Tax=Halorhodospira sp. 9621 TaxID=2899135 RepID=UPI003FCC72F9
MRPLLNKAELAKLLGITQRSLNRRRERDPESLPPAVRLGRSLRWRPDDVEEWLVRQTEGQASPRARRGRPRSHPRG